MTWLYQDSPITQLPQDCVGFVYVITNHLTNRKYLGKKLAKFRTTQQRIVRLKNGKKKTKRIRGSKNSDWQTYWGSNEELAADVVLLGEENFTREILFICHSKAECSYIEAREQFARRVLESDDWYNGHIQVRVHGSHIKGKLGING